MDFLTLVSDICEVICTHTSLKRGVRAVLSLLVENLSLEGACLFLSRGRVYVWPDGADFHEYRKALEGESAGGTEVFPLPKLRGEGKGFLVVKKQDFSLEDERVLEVVARQLGQFLRHVRVQRELRTGARLLLDLYSAGRDLGSVLDRNGLAQKLAEYAREFSEADLVSVTLFEGEGRRASLTLFVGKEDGDLIKFYNEDLYRRIVVPLATTKGNWGVLELYLSRDAAFSRHRKRVIHILAELAGTFLENITLYDRLKFLLEEREERIRFLSILYQVGNAYRWTSELRKRFFLALRALTDPHKGLGLPEAYVFIREEARGVLKGVMGVSWSGESPWGDQDWTVDEDYIKKVEASPAFVDLESVVPSGLPWGELEKVEVFYLTGEEGRLPFMKEGVSYVIFPLMAGDNLVGALLVGKEGGFDSEEIHFLTMFSHQLALAVESARLQEVLKVTGKELKEAQERFLHSEKLAALGELAARVVHDLKNPLVAIGGFARRLHEKMAEDCPDKVYTGTILKEVEEAEKILSNVLGYARVPSLKKRFADINALLDDILFLHAEEMRDRNIVLVKKLERSLPHISIDPAQMRQVFMNLVSNALQAIGKKGSVAVSTTRVERDGREYVKVEISDTGGGIPEEVLPNIFNPFFTTKSTGTGLGLSIAKRIVELHGGEIRVVNNPPVGATFVLYLPLGEEGENSNRSS